MKSEVEWVGTVEAHPSEGLHGQCCMLYVLDPRLPAARRRSMLALQRPQLWSRRAHCILLAPRPLGSALTLQCHRKAFLLGQHCAPLQARRLGFILLMMVAGFDETAETSPSRTASPINGHVCLTYWAQGNNCAFVADPLI